MADPYSDEVSFMLLKAVGTNLSDAHILSSSKPVVIDEEFQKRIIEDILKICEISNITVQFNEDEHEIIDIDVASIWSRRRLLHNTWKYCCEIMDNAEPIDQEYAMGIQENDNVD